MQDLRSVSGTAAWNVAIVVFCVEYIFSMYASNIEQQVLEEATVEASVNQTYRYSVAHSKIIDELRWTPANALTGLLVTPVCFYATSLRIT